VFWEMVKRKTLEDITNIASTRSTVPMAVEIPFESLKNLLNHESRIKHSPPNGHNSDVIIATN